MCEYYLKIVKILYFLLRICHNSYFISLKIFKLSIFLDVKTSSSCLAPFLKQRSREMAVYSTILLHIDLFSEETNGLTTVSVVLNICIYGCIHRIYVCIDSLSHGRRTLLSVSISFCRLADLEQETPCADTCMLKRITVGASFLIGQKRRHNVFLFFLFSPPSVSYALQKISQSLSEIERNIAIGSCEKIVK